MKKLPPYNDHQHAVRFLLDADWKMKHDVQDLLDLLEVEMPTLENSYAHD